MEPLSFLAYYFIFILFCHLHVVLLFFYTWFCAFNWLSCQFLCCSFTCLPLRFLNSNWKLFRRALISLEEVDELAVRPIYTVIPFSPITCLSQPALSLQLLSNTPPFCLLLEFVLMQLSFFSLWFPHCLLNKSGLWNEVEYITPLEQVSPSKGAFLSLLCHCLLQCQIQCQIQCQALCSSCCKNTAGTVRSKIHTVGCVREK